MYLFTLFSYTAFSTSIGLLLIFYLCYKINELKNKYEEASLKWITIIPDYLFGIISIISYSILAYAVFALLFSISDINYSNAIIIGFLGTMISVLYLHLHITFLILRK